MIEFLFPKEGDIVVDHCGVKLRVYRHMDDYVLEAINPPNGYGVSDINGSGNRGWRFTNDGIPKHRFKFAPYMETPLWKVLNEG